MSRWTCIALTHEPVLYYFNEKKAKKKTKWFNVIHAIEFRIWAQSICLIWIIVIVATRPLFSIKIYSGSRCFHAFCNRIDRFCKHSFFPLNFKYWTVVKMHTSLHLAFKQVKSLYHSFQAISLTFLSERERDRKKTKLSLGSANIV